MEDIYTVKLGVYNACTIEHSQKTFKIQKVLVHELYQKKTPYYDICLVTLIGDTAPFVPICLSKTGNQRRRALSNGTCCKLFKRMTTMVVLKKRQLSALVPLNSEETVLALSERPGFSSTMTTFAKK